MFDKKARGNEDIAKRLSEKDPLEGLSCSYKAYPIRLWIQDMKNYYEDYFNHASKHIHFIHFKARSGLPNDVVAKVEQSLKDQIDASTKAIDDAIEHSEALMKGSGITLAIDGTPNCSTPLSHTAKIISPLTNRYIQLIEKTDYVLRALDALFLDEVITMQEYNVRRGLFKSHIKRFYYACRNYDEGLRTRMDAELAKDQTTAGGKGNGSVDAQPGQVALSETIPAREKPPRRHRPTKAQPPPEVAA